MGYFSRQKLTGRNYFSSWECEPTRSTFSSRGHPTHLKFSCFQLDANVPQDDFCNGKHMFWALMHMFQMMIFLLKHKFCALKHSYFLLLDLVQRIIMVPQIVLHKLHAILMQDGTVTKENKKWKWNLRFLL